MTATTLEATVTPDGASLVIGGASPGAAVAVLDASSGESLAEGVAGDDGTLALTAEELVGRPTLAGRLLLAASGGLTALAFDRRPLLSDLRAAACELAGGCGRPLWFIEKFLLLRGLEAAAMTGDAARAARLWGLTGWAGARGGTGGRRGAAGAMRAETAAALARHFDALEALGRATAADVDDLLLSMALAEMADGDLADMLSADDRRLIAKAMERLSCSCAVEEERRPAPQGDNFTP